MPGVQASQYTGAFNKTWHGDPINAESVLPGGKRLDPAQFLPNDSVIVTASANALVGATSISVIGTLANSIPADTVLEFTGGKFAKVSSLGASAGASSIPVVALVQQINTNDVATYRGTGKINVYAGTPIGATAAEEDAGTPWGPAVSTDDYIYLTSHDVLDLRSVENDLVALYRHERVVYLKNLPYFSRMATALVNKLRTLYDCSSRGAD